MLIAMSILHPFAAFQREANLSNDGNERERRVNYLTISNNSSKQEQKKSANTATVTNYRNVINNNNCRLG